jgi:UDP-2-acetamido-2,6-beta-L-arabino-hexul-4-ose reductase
MRIGITGQSGFIGGHLFESLKKNDTHFTVPFKDEYFDNQVQLDEWVNQCEVVVHFAAMSRHEVPGTVCETNISLVKKLIIALDKAIIKPNIFFSSSIQEEFDNEYGRSKKEGRRLLHDWCLRNNCLFWGLIFPNVYGPNAKPKYASFIATFCYQLSHNEVPNIIVDSEVGLIHINDLVLIIDDLLKCNYGNPSYKVKITDHIKVSDVLRLLTNYRDIYLEKKQMPKIDTAFEHKLFDTFKSYINMKI